MHNLLQEYIERVPIHSREAAEHGFRWQIGQSMAVMGSQAMVIASTHSETFPEYVIVKLSRVLGVPSIVSWDFKNPVNDASLRLPELSLTKMMNLAFGLTGKLQLNARMAFEFTSVCFEKTLDKHVQCKNLQIMTRWNSKVERDALQIFDGSLLPDIDRLVAKHDRAAERFTKSA